MKLHYWGLIQQLKPSRARLLIKRLTYDDLRMLETTDDGTWLILLVARSNGSKVYYNKASGFNTNPPQTKENCYNYLHNTIDSKELTA